MSGAQTIRKAFDVPYSKALSKDGEFEAIVSVFGNVDLVNDRMMKGSFERTLKERGYPAIVYSHRWELVPMGVPLKAEEVEGFSFKNDAGDSITIDGLYIHGELFVDANQTARETHAALTRKGGDGRAALREFSFAFTPVKWSFEEDEEKGITVRNLEDVDLFEVGPTLVGANPETQLVAAKALAKARAGEKLDDKEFEALAGYVPTWDAHTLAHELDARARAGDGTKGVVAFREATALPPETAWDSDAERARADEDDLRAMSVFYDELDDGKSRFYGIHHRADSGHPVVWRGVRGAMRSLLAGAYPIPAKDKRAAYDHLAGHYSQFEKEPPEFRSAPLDESDLKSIFGDLDDAPVVDSKSAFDLLTIAPR
jgi:HK97 family phage prohead protease